MMKHIFLNIIISSILFSNSYMNAKGNDIRYYYYLGISRIQNNEFGLAVTAFLMALKKEKNSPEINVNLAEACLRYLENIDIQKNNYSKIEIYINMAEASLKMTYKNIMGYDQGKRITLFNSPHPKVIKEIKEKLIILKQQLSIYKSKFNKHKKEKIQISQKKMFGTKKKKKLPYLKDLPNKKVLSDQTSINTLQETKEQPALAKSPGRKVELEQNLIKALRKKNEKLLEQINRNKQEIETLKEKLLLLENEYAQEKSKTNVSYIKHKAQLKDDIRRLEVKMKEMGEKYQAQITRLKNEIAKENQKQSDDENDLPTKGKTSKYIFGGSILTSLLILLFL